MARIKTAHPAGDAPPRVPDRSLTPEEPLVTIAIRAAGTHQFVYRKMLEGPVGAATPNHGDIVRVVDRDGVELGYALWNGRSQISLRFLSRKNVPPGPDFWTSRIDDAVALRTKMLGLDRETNAYRVIHAEGDGLSGLIVDRYDDVLSVQTFSLGMYQRIGPILSLIAERLGTAPFSRRRRRASRPARRFLGPAPRQPATSTTRHRDRAWDSLPHSF